MLKKTLQFLVLFNLITTASVKAQDLLDIFYVKPYYGVHWNAIERSNINTSSPGSYSGSDKTILSVARNFGIGLGTKFSGFPMYVEGGGGITIWRK